MIRRTYSHALITRPVKISEKYPQSLSLGIDLREARKLRAYAAAELPLRVHGDRPSTGGSIAIPILAIDLRSAYHRRIAIRMLRHPPLS